MKIVLSVSHLLLFFTQTGQTLDICLKESNSDIPGQVTDVSLDTEKTSVPDTVSKVNDDQIISCISKECEARSLFLEFQEEKSVNSEKFEACDSTPLQY